MIDWCLRWASFSFRNKTMWKCLLLFMPLPWWCGCDLWPALLWASCCLSPWRVQTSRLRLTEVKRRFCLASAARMFLLLLLLWVKCSRLSASESHRMWSDEIFPKPRQQLICSTVGHLVWKRNISGPVIFLLVSWRWTIGCLQRKVRLSRASERRNVRVFIESEASLSSQRWSPA